jgi:hypothetical protein
MSTALTALLRLTDDDRYTRIIYDLDPPDAWAWAAGYLASDAGRAFQACPYAYRTVEGLSWRMGFMTKGRELRLAEHNAWLAHKDLGVVAKMRAAIMRRLRPAAPPALANPYAVQSGETVKEARDRWKLLEETMWVRPYDRQTVDFMVRQGWQLRITLHQDGVPLEAGLGRWLPEGEERPRDGLTWWQLAIIVLMAAQAAFLLYVHQH